MADRTRNEIDADLIQTFNHLNRVLDNLYTERHLQPLRDLIVESTFVTFKDTAELPMKGIEYWNLWFRADVVARNFLDAYADDIWPDRDRDHHREQDLVGIVANFVRYVFETEANRYGPGLVPHDLVKRLKVVGKKETVQGWIDQLPSTFQSFAELTHDSYTIKSLRQTQSDTDLSQARDKWVVVDRKALATRYSKEVDGCDGFRGLLLGKYC